MSHNPARSRAAALCVSGLIGALPSVGHADLLAAPTVDPSPPARLRAPVRPQATSPVSPRPDAATIGGAGTNPFSGSNVVSSATTPGQTLSAPVTVNASTGADALTVTQGGGGRAISGVVTSGSNGLSAVKGITAGMGSGVNGVNSGTAGPAGKFEITNAASAQPGLLVTTAGTGNGIQVIVKTASDAPAVLGQHVSPGYGTGVEGDGGYIGVYGTGATMGVYGQSGHNGVVGVGESLGVYGSSGSGTGVYGEGLGLGAPSYGVQGYSPHYAGVYGRSGVAIGVYGVSDSGKGVVGVSNTGYAGYFEGQLRTTSTMTAQSYATTSDRNAKQAFVAIDGGTVLDRIGALPISEWDYKDKPGIHHIGPMAQDFRAAFGLGADDTHIDLVDSVGVSLAAIKALQQRLDEKDARIAALELRAARADTAEAALEALAVRLTQLEQSQPAALAASRP